MSKNIEQIDGFGFCQLLHVKATVQITGWKYLLFLLRISTHNESLQIDHLYR